MGGNEAHHLIHVLRVKPQQKIICFDGLGNEADGVVTRVTRGSLFLKLEHPKAGPSLPWDVSLGMAVPRQGKLDEIVSKTTQLGIREILPLATARGVVKSDLARFERKRERLSQIAIEAAKQCGVNRLPTIHPVISWKEVCHRFGDYDLTLMAAIEGPHENLNQLISRGHPAKSLVLIGPEGDFTPEEISAAVHAGAHRFSLSPHILRCETAAVVAVGLVSFFLQDKFSRCCP